MLRADLCAVTVAEGWASASDESEMRDAASSSWETVEMEPLDYWPKLLAETGAAETESGKASDNEKTANAKGWDRGAFALFVPTRGSPEHFRRPMSITGCDSECVVPSRGMSFGSRFTA